MNETDRFEREMADMFRRRRERRDAIYRGENPPSPLDVLYKIMKESPDVESGKFDMEMREFMKKEYG
ncbi:MAG TPA: hypothetical protein VJ485_04160 [archaeon]|nr:hypothetical protein [archaeon]